MNHPIPYICPDCGVILYYDKKKWSPIYLYFFCSSCGCKIFKIDPTTREEAKEYTEKEKELAQEIAQEIKERTETPEQAEGK